MNPLSVYRFKIINEIIVLSQHHVQIMLFLDWNLFFTTKTPTIILLLKA